MKKDAPKNNFANRSDELMPRELMERAASPSKVSDEALLAILLKTGAQGLDVLQLSHRLLTAFGSLKSLLSADWRGLEERIRLYNAKHPDEPIRGIGHVKCLELAAAFEMGRRWARLSPNEIKKRKIDGAEDAFAVFKTVANPEDGNESVYVLLLDAKCHPLCEPVKAIRGEIASAAFSPKEIFREAVRWGASAVIVAHNHPSGNLEPSDDDLELTRQMIAVSEVVSIPLLDHLVLGSAADGSPSYFSVRETNPSIFNEG